MKIVLSTPEKQWILLCKGHFKNEYPFEKDWVTTFKPLFEEIYGWCPDEDNNYQDYLNCLFNKFLDIFVKINDDQTLSNNLIKEVFDSAFYKRIGNESESPIERAIVRLRGLIAINKVTDNGVERYSLKL